MNAITKMLAGMLMFSVMASANATYTLNQNGGNGSISGVYPSFTITGDNSNKGLLITSYSDTISAGGTITFNWEYSSEDDPTADYAGYFINGDKFELASAAASGSEAISLNANDIFGWYVGTEDGQFEPGILKVISASFKEDGDTSKVPEPTSLALLGLALASLAGSRRHKI